MELYGSHFEFDGKSSKAYDLIFASANVERYVKITDGIEGNSIFNNKNLKKYYIGDDYSSAPLMFEVEIITDDVRTLQIGERREIEKWLFNRSDFRKLYLDIEDDYECETIEYIDGVAKRLFMNCRFLNPEKIERDNGVVGYRATMETDSPFVWQDAITVECELETTGTGAIDVYVDSDYDGYIYPRVQISTSVGGSVTIKNGTDDATRETTFDGFYTNDSVTIDGNNNYVTSGYAEKFTSRNFVRLLDGRNNLLITSTSETPVTQGTPACTVTITWNNRRTY